MQLRKLFENTSINYNEDLNIDIKTVTTDSRKITKDTLFCAVNGTDSNGEDFISDAVNKGAVSVLSAKDIELPPGTKLFTSKDLRKDIALIAKNLFGKSDEYLDIHAVTGTNGKTSVVFALSRILNFAGIKTGYISTIEKSWDNKIFESKLTTPDSFELHKAFKSMLDSGCKACVMEASSHGIHQSRLHGIHLKQKILTNVTKDHLDYHKTIEEYWEVKEKFLKDGEETSIVNLNDSVGRKVAQKKINVLTYGIENSKAILYAKDIHFDLSGLTMTLVYKNSEKKIFVKNIIGKFMVENLLAAILSALSLNIPLDIILESVESFEPPKGRLSRLEGFNGSEIFIDYAHTPDALQKVILTLKPYVKNRLKVVFGCGGNRDRTKRSEMGNIADSLADDIYLTSDNPRWEEPESIIAEIKNGIKRKENFFCNEDRKKTICTAVKDCRNGDILLIAGKGHEDYQEIKGVRSHFSDFEIAGSFVNKLKMKIKKD